MEYFWQSIKTRSYWAYALLSIDSIKSFLAVLGSFWLLIEMANFFKIPESENLPPYTFLILIVVSLFVVIVTRRPISRISYKLAGRDLNIEVVIGNIFKVKGQRVISTNTTFDTDIGNGIIAATSLQGQFTNLYFPQRIGVLDQLIEGNLNDVQFENFEKVAGKSKKYPMGTTIRVDIGNEIFYLLAMSHLNYDNTAKSSFEDIIDSMESLWKFLIERGENETLVIPLIGTGRGRITTNRKRLIARIAQSFIRASEEQIFSNKLVIVIHPKDAREYNINLFEVKDLLNNYLP